MSTVRTSLILKNVTEHEGPWAHSGHISNSETGGNGVEDKPNSETGG